MFRSLDRVLMLVALAAGGAVLAAPAPNETRKPAAFPTGHYVLTGAGEPALGDDTFEFTEPFRLKPGQYILSGGSKPTDLIVVDDDLEVYQEKTALFIDDDHVRSTETRGKEAAQYQGKPIILVLDPAKKLRIVAIDCHQTQAIIGELWLHRWDGARKKLTSGKNEQSAAKLPFAFFDESFAISDGFEMPEKVSTDAKFDVPAKPATLLPRFKSTAPAPGTSDSKPGSPAPPAPPAPNAPKVPDASDFVKDAVTNGLNEAGVEPALAADLGKRDDFLGKCFLCQPTKQALVAYGKLKSAPTCPKEARPIPEELVKRLKSNDDDTRRAALRDFVKRCVDAEYARRDLTKEQQVALQAEMEKMRKLMSGALPSGQKFCASCDGACRIGAK